MEAPCLKIDLGISSPVIQGGREDARLHGGHPSDEAVDAGSAQGVADLGLEGGEHCPLRRWEKGLEGLDLLHVTLNRARGMAFHHVHLLGTVTRIPEGAPNGNQLSLGQGLHHAPIIVARSYPGDVGVNRGTTLSRDRLPLHNDHASSFAEDHAVALRIKGPAALLGRPFDAREPGQGFERGEFEVMGGVEELLSAAHNGCVEDVVSDHLERVEEGHQAGGACSGDRVARAP